MYSATKQLTANDENDRRTVRTSFPHKRLSTPREALNRESGSGHSEGSDAASSRTVCDGQKASGVRGCPWHFNLAPVGGDVTTWKERYAAATEVAKANGLHLTITSITVLCEPDGDGPPAETRVKKWLKRVGRAVGLKARWPGGGAADTQEGDE
jgi:hypothetical protein